MPVVACLRKWGPRLAGVVGAQSLVQVCNALSGMLAVWFLPRESAYAWFTVAGSMMIMMTLLSDCGITAAVQAVGGPVWDDRSLFSQTVKAVRRWQGRQVLAAVLVVIPWMLVLLHQMHAPAWSMVLAAVLLAGCAWPAAAGQIWSHVNRLHSKLRAQLKAELAGAGVRLLLTAAVLGGTCWFMDDLPARLPAAAFILALAAACAATCLMHHLLRRVAAQLVDVEVQDSLELETRVRGIVSGTVVFTIYYGLQGQVSTWLMSWHGVADRVADVGALGRLGLFFALATAPVVQIAMPSFARCRERGQLLRQLGLVCGCYLAVTLGGLLLVAMLPGPVLWILGPQYAHLGAELPLAVLVPAAGGLTGLAWGLVMARGWGQSSAWVLPAGLSGQIAGLFLFDLTTVSGVLAFNAFILLPVLLVSGVIIWRGVQNWEMGKQKVEIEKQKLESGKQK